MTQKPLDFLSRSIGQIGYVVEDVDKAVENYYTQSGIGGWNFYTYGAPLFKFMNYRGKPADFRFRLALSYFGETRVELIQPLSGPTIYSDFIEQHGYGIQHLGIYVENIREEIEKAENAGIPVIMEGGGFGPDGDGHFAYLDTEKDFGITYELIQRPAGRHAPEKTYP